MRCPVVLITALLAAVGGASCSEKGQPKEDGVALADVSGQRGGSKSAGKSDQPPIPKGAQWTILCREIHGPDHVSLSKQHKDALMKTPGMRDWHLLHKEDYSVLYYGFYRSYTEPRAKADRAKIDAMTDANGRRPFRQAHLTPLDAADPGGPPEWNLANAKGYWSLQVGVYKDSPERKQYAVDAVKDARQRGIEAYYYHGETMSLVCVGSWPREAVRLAEESSGPGDNGQLKVVLPPLPPNVEKAPEIRGEGGRKLHVEASRNVIVDPTMRAMMDQFKEMATNGTVMATRRTNPRTGQVDIIEDKSFPVRIPSQDSAMLDSGGVPLPSPEGAYDATTPSNGFRTGTIGGNSGTTPRRSTNGS
jgi:hypothetical protein